MKKIFLIIVVLLSASWGMFAQMPGRYGRNVEYNVSGQVKDKQTKEPVPYCPVLILNGKDSTVAFSLTNAKGYFTIPVKRGKYKLQVRFMGYETVVMPLQVSDGDKFIGTIKLAPKTNKLKTVVVKQATTKNLVDRDEVLVTEKLKSGAATATDVLDRINGISYDRYDDHIEVDNSEDVLFMVNGLEKDEDYIKNINPDRIKKVEIIRDPGGRYGLEGYSAIINVVLKDNYVGHELALASMGTIDIDTKDKNYLMPMKGGRISYNFSSKKTNIYFQVRSFNLEAGVFQTVRKEMDTLLILQSPEKENEYNSVFAFRRAGIVGGIDYTFNPKHQISFEVSSRMTPPTEVFANYNEEYFANDTLLASGFYHSTSSSKSNNLGSKLFYNANFSERSQLHTDFRTNYSTSSSETNFTDPTYSSTTNVNSETKSGEFNADWSYMFTKNWGIQTGYGFRMRDLQSNTVYENLSYEKKSLYKEIRNRMFLYSTLHITSQITFKGGIAYELSNPEVEGKVYSFSILQPYVDAQYKPSKFFNVKLKYRTRSIYPSVSQVNPNTVYLDAQRIQRGNPNLKPTAIHKISLKFNFMGGMMYFEPYYNFSDGYIATVITQDTTGKILYTYDNVGIYEDKGVKGSFTIPVTKKLMWRNNFKIFNSRMAYNDYDNSFTDWGGGSNLMYLDRRHNLIAGLMYKRQMFKRITLQGYNMNRNNYWGLMLQKSFFKKRLNVMAFYMLPIDFLMNYNRKSYAQTEFYTQTTISDASSIKNIFFMRLSYNFSKGKVVKKKTNDSGMEDLQMF